MTLVDSGTGNLFSLREAFRREGATVELASSEEGVRDSTCLVLPGVASFPAVARGIADARGALLRSVEDGVPLLGICAGMQVLFEGSDEGPGEGLGLLSGRIAKLSAPVVPNMGWSRLRLLRNPWFSEIADGPMVYFAHSFAAPADAPDVVATADHGGPFAAAVRRRSIFGVQFHPEKSGRVGGAVLRGFLREAGVIPSG